jgi:hypothetical protein
MNLYSKQPRSGFYLNPEHAPTERKVDWDEVVHVALVIFAVLFGAVIVILTHPTPCTNCR